MVLGHLCVPSHAREIGMKIDAVRQRVWTKPEIRRLGAIRDVAGNQGAGTQGAGAKT